MSCASTAVVQRTAESPRCPGLVTKGEALLATFSFALLLARRRKLLRVGSNIAPLLITFAWNFASAPDLFSSCTRMRQASAKLRDSSSGSGKLKIVSAKTLAPCSPSGLALRGAALARAPPVDSYMPKDRLPV